MTDDDKTSAEDENKDKSISDAIIFERHQIPKIPSILYKEKSEMDNDIIKEKLEALKHDDKILEKNPRKTIRNFNYFGKGKS